MPGIVVRQVLAMQATREQQSWEGLELCPRSCDSVQSREGLELCPRSCDSVRACYHCKYL